MRTTLTLDEDVAEALATEMRRNGSGMKSAVNQALRRGFGLSGDEAQRRTRFVVKARRMGRPLMDLTHANRLLDELDIEQYLRKAGRRRGR